MKLLFLLKKYYYIVVIVFFILCIYNTYKEYFYSTSLIVFPSKNEVENVFKNIDYFNSMNSTDKHVRNIKTQNKSEIIKQYMLSIMNIDEQLKIKIRHVINEIENTVSMSLFHTIPWKIVVFKNIENNYPHTHKDIIFIPYSMIDNLSNYKDTLVHEKVHVLQRKKADMFKDLYKNYWHTHKVNLSKGNHDIIYSYLRANPDTDTNNWVFMYNNKRIIFKAMYKENASHLGDVDYIGLFLDSNNNVIDKKGLTDIKEFTDFYGHKYSNHYHPNELSAEMISSHLFNKESKSKAYDQLKLWLNKID